MKTWNKPYFYHHDEEWNLNFVSVGIDDLDKEVAVSHFFDISIFFFYIKHLFPGY